MSLIGKLTFTQKFSFQWKNSFLWLVNTSVEHYWSHAGQVKRKVNCSKLFLKCKPIRIAIHKKRPVLKHGQIHVAKWIPPLRRLFSTRKGERHAKREFRTLKNQQGWNYLNQKIIAAINNVDGSTFGDNLITCHQ